MASCDTVRHKCSEMHDGCKLKFTEAGSWIMLAVNIVVEDVDKFEYLLQ